MATEGIKTAFLSCRYCLTNSIKHIVQYFFSDTQDKYEKMLEDTFSIQIRFSENKYLCLECEENIRNAADIKKRVLNVQTILLERNEKLTLVVTDEPESPKQVISSDYEESNFEQGGRIKDGGTGGGSIRDGGTQDALKNTNAGNGDVHNEVKKCYVNIERKKNETPPRLKRKTTTKAVRKVSDSRTAVNNVKETQKSTKTTEQDKHVPTVFTESIIKMRKDTLSLLNNSNMCIFTSKKNKYACYFCNDIFLDMRKLRAHSLTHKKDKIDKIKHTICQNRGLSLKTVDISNLTCKKCSHPCTDLEKLRVHLKNNHDEAFEGTEHLLVPFKIENGFECVICQKEFLTFLSLFIHMNCHSSYNVCEICGLSFINRAGLRNHIKAVHTQSKCTVCSALFSTTAARTKHLRVAHNTGQTKRYCTQCDMVFSYNYKLSKHMIEKHGAKRTVNICKCCKKEFASAAGAKMHYKGVHLGEREHKCSVCDMSFFTSFDRKRHERTHGDEKPFCCESCDIKFRSKYSMQRHLRRKHGHGSFIKV